LQSFLLYVVNLRCLSFVIEGIWDNTLAGSAEFNNDFYDELVQRAWRPRFNGVGDAADWTWAGPGNANFPFLMLHTDICLRFDIPENGLESACCTNTDNNCRNTFQNVQCPDSSEVRPEAFAAVEEFRNQNRRLSKDELRRPVMRGKGGGMPV